MWFLHGGLILVLATAVYCIHITRREFQTRDTFRPSIVATVWVLYIVHAALTVAAVWLRVWPLPLSKALSIVAGVALFAAGVAFDLAGVAAFRSFRRMSGLVADRLVTTGAYRFSRNPQNVGLGLAYVGLGLIGRSGYALLLALVFWGIFLAYVPSEEQLLERLYGDQYRRYRQRVPRILGLPRS
jgi:protein-S-isoprenylcysteine O-methyltransferase Ste14